MGFVQDMQMALFGECLAPWMRKGSAWLDINCGDGRYLPPLLQKGCNVEAMEADPAARTLARERTSGCVDIAAGTGDRLPYADNYFDFAVLHLEAVPANSLGAMLEEMCRVAERGMAVTFWNSTSLGGLGNFAGIAAHALPWSTVRAALQQLGKGRPCARSTLCLPTATWHASSCLAACNRLCTGLPFGAWMVVRLDLKAQRTGTPLTLRIPSMRSGEAAMNQ